MAITTIDEFCRVRGIVPTHIKIDVDGPEAAVMRGMKQVLASEQLQSVLVEIMSPESGAEIRDMLAMAGFREQPHQYQNAYNVIFRRMP